MMIQPFRKKLRAFVRPKWQHIYRVNSAAGRFRDPVWLIGAARSGTTWLSSLLNYHGRFREMFEPFHPEANGQVSNVLKPFQYIPPGGENRELEALASNIFSGKYSHRRVDKESLRIWYDGLVIKDIFANLFAAWACRRFNIQKTILLLRNPFSVAHSKSRHRSWFDSTDTLAALKQEELIRDYLNPFTHIIREVEKRDDFLINQILLWSVINYVPLKQFNTNHLHVVYFEDLYANPEEQLQKIYASLFPGILQKEITLQKKIIASPSRYSRKNRDQLTKKNLLHRWKKDLSDTQIKAGTDILKAFGLYDIYGKGIEPDRRIADKLLSSGTA